MKCHRAPTWNLVETKHTNNKRWSLMSTVLELWKTCFWRPSRSLVKSSKVFRRLNLSMHRRKYLGVAGTPPSPHRPLGPRCSPQMPYGGDFHAGLEAHGSSPVWQSLEEGEQGDVRKKPPTKQPGFLLREACLLFSNFSGPETWVSHKLLSSYKLARLCSKHLAMGWKVITPQCYLPFLDYWGKGLCS